MSTPNAHEYHIITMIYRLATNNEQKKRSRLHFNMFMRIWIERMNERTKKKKREATAKRKKKKRHDTKCYTENKYNDDDEQKRNINSGSNASGKTEQIANYLVRPCCCVGANRNVHASVYVWVARAGAYRALMLAARLDWYACVK